MNTQLSLNKHLKIELQSLKRIALDLIFISLAIVLILARMIWFMIFGYKYNQRPEIEDPIFEGDIISNNFRNR